MIMCVLLCYPVSIHMSQLQATGRPISSLKKQLAYNLYTKVQYLKALKTDDPLHIFTDFSSVNM